MIEQDGKPVLRISGEIYGCADHARGVLQLPLPRQIQAGARRNGSRGSPSPRIPESCITAAASSASTTGSPGRCRTSSRSSSTASASTGRRPPRPSTSARDPKAPGAEAPRWNPAGAVDGVRRRPTIMRSRVRMKTGPGEWNRLELVCFQDAACTSSMARWSWRCGMRATRTAASGCR